MIGIYLYGVECFLEEDLLMLKPDWFSTQDLGLNDVKSMPLLSFQILQFADKQLSALQ